MSLIIIAAVAQNGVIGKKNDLPWNIPEDLQHFQEITQGKNVLMGQKTFESILARLGKPLPDRHNIVVSKDPDFQAPSGVEVFSDLTEALKKYINTDIYIAGGASIYQQTISMADRLFITRVNLEPEGDAFFPEIDPSVWRLVSERDYGRYAFLTYQRKN